jgi:hypothetical protein
MPIPGQQRHTNTVGYKLHTGFSSGNYTQTTEPGDSTADTVPLTKSGSTYFFIVTPYNTAGTEVPSPTRFPSPHHRANGAAGRER